MKNYFRGVMQHDAQDCGAACLTSIIHFWGNNARALTFIQLG